MAGMRVGRTVGGAAAGDLDAGRSLLGTLLTSTSSLADVVLVVVDDDSGSRRREEW